MLPVILIGTEQTKATELTCFRDMLSSYGLSVKTIDTSLYMPACDGSTKIVAMKESIERGFIGVTDIIKQVGGAVVVGLGGGTGGEIALAIMSRLPFHLSKVLITTLPFDPRAALSDNTITIVPTVADIAGLNATLRASFDHAASLVFGLSQRRVNENPLAEKPSVGITSLGVTQQGVETLVAELNAKGHETTVFHANGFGGAAYSRWAKENAFYAAIDFTTHEITRQLLLGAKADLSSRFSCVVTAKLPQVVVPGGINFIGLGALEALDKNLLKRPHYKHSNYFTHVQVNESEMALCAKALIRQLDQSQEGVTLMVPMAGFSSRDCRGGEIESLKLREVFLDTCLRFGSETVDIQVFDQLHVNDPVFAHHCVEQLIESLRKTENVV